jgi:hypothetical protein
LNQNLTKIVTGNLRGLYVGIASQRRQKALHVNNRKEKGVEQPAGNQSYYKNDLEYSSNFLIYSQFRLDYPINHKALIFSAFFVPLTELRMFLRILSYQSH